MLFSSLSIFETFNCTSVQFKNIEPPVQVCTFTLVFVPSYGGVSVQKLVLQHMHTTHAHSLNLETQSLLPVCLPVKVVFI